MILQGIRKAYEAELFHVVQGSLVFYVWPFMQPDTADDVYDEGLMKVASGV